MDERGIMSKNQVGILGAEAGNLRFLMTARRGRRD